MVGTKGEGRTPPHASKNPLPYHYTIVGERLGSTHQEGPRSFPLSFMGPFTYKEIPCFRRPPFRPSHHIPPSLSHTHTSTCPHNRLRGLGERGGFEKDALGGAYEICESGSVFGSPRIMPHICEKNLALLAN